MSPLCKADGRLVVITCGDNIYKNTEMCKHAVSYNREPKRMAAMQTLVILKCVCAWGDGVGEGGIDEVGHTSRPGLVSSE